MNMFLKSLEDMPKAERGGACLDVAAALIESAAYDLAGLQASARVARLILMAAEVSRMAASVQSQADLSEAC